MNDMSVLGGLGRAVSPELWGVISGTTLLPGRRVGPASLGFGRGYRPKICDRARAAAQLEIVNGLSREVSFVRMAQYFELRRRRSLAETGRRQVKAVMSDLRVARWSSLRRGETLDFPTFIENDGLLLAPGHSATGNRPIGVFEGSDLTGKRVLKMMVMRQGRLNECRHGDFGVSKIV